MTRNPQWPSLLTFTKWWTKHKNQQNEMSLDDTLPDIWFLISVEICFLTIYNDLEWRFWPKSFALFGFLKVEGKKMVLGVWTDGFCRKTVTLCYLTHAAWVK